MIVYRCKKLYGGKVSVRDYLVKYAKKTGQVIEVEFEGLRMKISGTTPYTTDNHPHIALHTDKYIKAGSVYRLWDYTWNPALMQPTEYTERGLEMLHGAMEKIFGKK